MITTKQQQKKIVSPVLVVELTVGSDTSINSYPTIRPTIHTDFFLLKICQNADFPPKKLDEIQVFFVNGMPKAFPYSYKLFS